MELKVIYRVARRYSAAVLCLATLFAGGALFLWNGYKDLDAQKVAFEKEKFTVAEAQFKREVELQKREFLVTLTESRNVEKTAQFKAKELEQEKISALLMVEQRSISKAQIDKAAEEKKKEEIVKAMKKDFKGPKPAMYAIATDKAKDLAEIIAKKLKVCFVHN